MRQVEYVPLGRFRVSPSLQLIVSRRKYFKHTSVVIGQFVSDPNDEVLGYFRKNASVQLRLDQFYELARWFGELADKLRAEENKQNDRREDS